jgi:hypothetical protein
VEVGGGVEDDEVDGCTFFSDWFSDSVTSRDLQQP